MTYEDNIWDTFQAGHLNHLGIPMHNKDLMSPETQEAYEVLVKAKEKMLIEHTRIMSIPFKNRTDEEKTVLLELTKALHECERLREQIWNAHSLVQIVLKQIHKK